MLYNDIVIFGDKKSDVIITGEDDQTCHHVTAIFLYFTSQFETWSRTACFVRRIEDHVVTFDAFTSIVILSLLNANIFLFSSRMLTNDDHDASNRRTKYSLDQHFLEKHQQNLRFGHGEYFYFLLLWTWLSWRKSRVVTFVHLNAFISRTSFLSSIVRFDFFPFFSCLRKHSSFVDLQAEFELCSLELDYYLFEESNKKGCGSFPLTKKRSCKLTMSSFLAILPFVCCISWVVTSSSSFRLSSLSFCANHTLDCNIRFVLNEK